MDNREKKNLYFRSLPLHHSQQVVAQTDEYTIFSCFLQPTYDFRQELLSHGAEVEVLSPLNFFLFVSPQRVYLKSGT